MKPSFVETTIPSYLVGGISPTLATAAHQMATRRWWEERRDVYRLFVSSAVDEEIGRGDALLSRQRQDVLIGLPRLSVTDEVIRLAEELFAHLKLDVRKNGRIPLGGKLAISDGLFPDVIFETHCRRPCASCSSQLHDASGIHIPVICTPEELLEWEDQS